MDERERGKKLMNELLIWLNNADIDFSVKLWDSGEGKSIQLEKGIEIDIYDSGLIQIENNFFEKEVEND